MKLPIQAGSPPGRPTGPNSESEAFDSPNEGRKVQFERVVKQFRMIFFPGRHGLVERVQNVLNIIAGRGLKAAAMLLIQIGDLDVSDFAVAYALAGIDPELLPLRHGRRQIMRHLFTLAPT